MKKFAKNIAERVRNSYHVRVTKGDNCTTLQWGKSMYCLSWQVPDGNIDGDGLFVTLEDLEKGKTPILAIAEKI